MTPRRLIVFFKLTLVASCQGSAPPPAESETEPSSRHTRDTRFVEQAEDDGTVLITNHASRATTRLIPSGLATPAILPPEIHQPLRVVPGQRTVL